MTEPIDEAAVHALIVELNERLDKATADYIRRQEARKAEREEFARRRAYGLTQRHARKTAHLRRQED